MLKEASRCKPWLSGYLDEASGYHRLLDPETSKNRDAAEQIIFILSTPFRKKKDWKTDSE